MGTLGILTGMQPRPEVHRSALKAEVRSVLCCTSTSRWWLAVVYGTGTAVCRDKKNVKYVSRML